MKRMILGGLAALALCPIGCDVHDPYGPCLCGGSSYREQTSPESVVFNLETSYRRKEIDEYAKLLAPEFKFEVRPGDRSLISEEFWTRDDDSTGTSNLFRAPHVTDIRIDLTHGPVQESTEEGFDPGTQVIRVDPTFLEVDQSDGITWRVEGDIQELYFRQGDAALGENEEHWYILEWIEIRVETTVPDSLGIQLTTWSALKSRYGES